MDMSAGWFAYYYVCGVVALIAWSDKLTPALSRIPALDRSWLAVKGGIRWALTVGHRWEWLR